MSQRRKTAAAAADRGAAAAAPKPRKLNQKVVEAEYAVRGELVIKADQYRQQMEGKATGLPFKEIIACNIGNPQELGQKPLDFFRQVVALCQYPAAAATPEGQRIFAPDAIQRAQAYLASMKTTGAYTSSQGTRAVREEVAAFIERRDGYKSSAEDIYLTDGASSGVKAVIQLLISAPNDGVMIPIPQYPLYSATLTLCGGVQCGYYLDEANGWALSRAELERSLKAAQKKGVSVKALVVINPGNPTGQVLSRKNMEEVVEFCHANGVLLMADEVYQTNIYASTPFTSFKKVVHAMPKKYHNLELVSFHSVSKGFLGECGQRGGYMEVCGVDAAFRAQLLKFASISLCSNSTGQIMTGLMVNPPAEGSPSYAHYCQQRDDTLASLKRRAKVLADTLNTLSGVRCNAIEGAMYGFPMVALPPAFVAEAKKQNKQPDVLYCLRLLEQTGIVVVPGSGFGQIPGTWHFRTTILPSEAAIAELLGRMRTFQEQLMHEYGYKKSDFDAALAARAGRTPHTASRL